MKHETDHAGDDGGTMGLILEEQARRIPDRPFLTFTEQGYTLSYDEFNREVNRVAHGLVGLGVESGRMVAMILRTRPEYLVVSYALKKIGAIEAGINGENPKDKIREQLTTVEPEWVVVEDAFVGQLGSLLEGVVAPGAVIEVGEEPGVRGVRDKRRVAFAEVVSSDTRNPEYTKGDPYSTAMIVMSSGTTGASKAIQLSDRMATTYAGGMAHAYDIGGDDCVYVPWPLFHATGAICDVFTALYTGTQAVVAPKLSARAFWGHVRRFGATWVSSVGILQKILMNAPPAADDRNHTLRLMWGGPHPVDRATFRERFGVECSLSYGTSETGLLGFQQPGDPEFSCGRIRRSVYDVEIVNDDGEPMPCGTQGEIVCRARMPGAITAGYYGRPDLTARTIVNGWFRTGDVGWLDADDNLYFVERRDSMIRRRGENVAPGEVEALLERHPCVRKSAVVGIPGELGDFDIAAFVEADRDSGVSSEQILAHCREQGPKWMIPARIVIVESFPMTSTGKPAIAELKSYLESSSA